MEDAACAAVVRWWGGWGGGLEDYDGLGVGESCVVGVRHLLGVRV